LQALVQGESVYDRGEKRIQGKLDLISLRSGLED